MPRPQTRTREPGHAWSDAFISSDVPTCGARHGFQFRREVSAGGGLGIVRGRGPGAPRARQLKADGPCQLAQATVPCCSKDPRYGDGPQRGEVALVPDTCPCCRSMLCHREGRASQVDALPEGSRAAWTSRARGRGSAHPTQRETPLPRPTPPNPPTTTTAAPAAPSFGAFK